MLPEYLATAHPLLVHFPVALLVVAAVVEILAVLRPRQEQLQVIAGALLTLGALLLIPTYLTGRQAVDALSSPFPRTEAAAATHADWAWRTLWLFLVLASVRLGLQWRGRLRGAAHLVLAIVSVLGLFLVFETAEHGGELVYDLGAGVRPVREAPEGAFDPPPEVDVSELGPTLAADGSLRWQFRPGAEEALASFVNALTGQIPAATVQARESSLVLDVESDAPRLLTLGAPMQDMTMSLQLDASDFRGTVALVHHVTGPDDFDFLRLSKGELELGRRRAGADTILDTAAAAQADGMNELEAVAAGRHLRGYIGGALLVHGHGDPSPRGPVGLFIEGVGKLRIDDLRVRPLEQE